MVIKSPRFTAVRHLHDTDQLPLRQFREEENMVGGPKQCQFSVPDLVAHTSVEC